MQASLAATTSSFRMESSAFAEGQPIPKLYTGEGKDISPPLTWTDPPLGAEEFTLICDDPDAPRADPWVHWVIYKIPGDVRTLPENLPRRTVLQTPPGARQGANSWGADNVGYRGPMPPPGHGRHRYYFRLYALDAPLDLPEQATKDSLLAAMKGHVLAEATLMGTYERK